VHHTVTPFGTVAYLKYNRLYIHRRKVNFTFIGYHALCFVFLLTAVFFYKFKHIAGSLEHPKNRLGLSAVMDLWKTTQWGTLVCVTTLFFVVALITNNSSLDHAVKSVCSQCGLLLVDFSTVLLRLLMCCE